MREILFKAKRLDNGEWVEGHYFTRPNTQEEEQHYIVNIKATYFYQIDPNTLCQFTGLTDKDGNKIWENDIVGYFDGKEIKSPSIVEYGNWGCEFWHDVYGYIFSPKEEEEEYKVIGNKFDDFRFLEGDN